MKYPYFSNWAISEKTNQDTYFIRNDVLGKECVLSIDDYLYAQKLNGWVNPYAIKGNRGWHETKKLLEYFERNGVIRNDHGRINSDGLGYLKTLIRVDNSKHKAKVSHMLNLILILGFIPIFIIGVFVYLNSDGADTSGLCGFIKMIYQYEMLTSWIVNIMAVVLGGIIHEICHGNACRGYGGRVYEYGIIVGILPGFYTLMNQDIKNRLKRIQILSAGIEGNIMFAGLLLCMTGLIPEMRSFFLEAAGINIAMACLNVTFIKGTDGSKIAMLLLGIDDTERLSRTRKIIRNANCRRKLKDEGLTGYVKLTACYILVCLQMALHLLVLVDIMSIIGVFV